MMIKNKCTTDNQHHEADLNGQIQSNDQSHDCTYKHYLSLNKQKLVPRSRRKLELMMNQLGQSIMLNYQLLGLIHILHKLLIQGNLFRLGKSFLKLMDLLIHTSSMKILCLLDILCCFPMLSCCLLESFQRLKLC